MNDVQTECLAYHHNKLSVIRTSLAEDARRYFESSAENQGIGNKLKMLLRPILAPQLLCLFLYRLAHCLYVKRWSRSARGVTRLNFLVHKINISPQSCIGPGFYLPHPTGVVFHGRAGRGLTLYSLSVCCSFEDSLDGPVEIAPRLGDNVTVAAHAVLLGPINVGDDTKMAIGVRLVQDTPPGVIVVSNLFHQTPRPISVADAAGPI